MNEVFYQQFGQLLRSARKSAGLSQEDLAKAIGLTRTSVSNIEKGRQKVLLHTFAELLGVLQLPAPDLLPARATDSSKLAMSLDELKNSDTSGFEFVYRAGIGQRTKEEGHENQGDENPQRGQPDT